MSKPSLVAVSPAPTFGKAQQRSTKNKKLFLPLRCMLPSAWRFSLPLLTWPGQVAKRYCAGGPMSTAMPRDAFQNLLGPTKQVQAHYPPQIQQKIATLDAGQIMALMRGNTEGLA